MDEIKYCTSCGQPIVQGTKFCTSCGNSLVDIGEITSISEDSQAATTNSLTQTSTQPTPQSPQGKGKLLPIAIVTALLVGGALLFFQPWKSSDPDQTTATNTSESKPAENDGNAGNSGNLNRGVPNPPPPGSYAPVKTWPALNPPTGANPCRDPFPAGDEIVTQGSSSTDTSSLAVQGTQASLAAIGFTADGGESAPLAVTGRFDQDTVNAVHRYVNKKASVKDAPESWPRYTESPSEPMIESTLWASLKDWLTYRKLC